MSIQHSLKNSWLGGGQSFKLAIRIFYWIMITLLKILYMVLNSKIHWLIIYPRNSYGKLLRFWAIFGLTTDKIKLFMIPWQQSLWKIGIFHTCCYWIHGCIELTFGERTALRLGPIVHVIGKFCWPDQFNLLTLVW